MNDQNKIQGKTSPLLWALVGVGGGLALYHLVAKMAAETQRAAASPYARGLGPARDDLDLEMDF